MEADRSGEVTQILAAVRGGSDSAVRRLLPLVYDELRAAAERMFRRQPANHTWQATALVHDAFLRLVRAPDADFVDRAHFLAVAAKAMRNLLIDHARKKRAQKHGSDWERVTLTGLSDVPAKSSTDLLAVDEAIRDLSRLNERHARIVEPRFFGGLTIPETAAVLNVSESTVEKDWTVARAWLARQLSNGSRS